MKVLFLISIALGALATVTCQNQRLQPIRIPDIKTACAKVSAGLQSFDPYVILPESSDICEKIGYPVFLKRDVRLYGDFCASMYWDMMKQWKGTLGSGNPNPTHPGLKPCIDSAKKAFFFTLPPPPTRGPLLVPSAPGTKE